MKRDKKERYILVTASVAQEAEGIKTQLASMHRKEIGGRPAFEGMIGPARVSLLIAGPGMVNTTQAITAAIEVGAPEMILMTGCAGGFKRAGMKVGDIGIATEENDAHLGIEPEREGMPPAPLPFALDEVDGVQVGTRIQMDHRLTRRVAAVLDDGFGQFQRSIGILSGPFATVSTITATDRGADRLYDRFQACMENMEGAAGAQVAMHYRIPFLEIRCASNLVGKRNRGAWDLPLACRRSAEAAVMWMRSIDW